MSLGCSVPQQISQLPKTSQTSFSMPNVNTGLKRRTMVKPIVGKCRTHTYKLPSDPNFTYGMVNKASWARVCLGFI